MSGRKCWDYHSVRKHCCDIKKRKKRFVINKISSLRMAYIWKCFCFSNDRLRIIRKWRFHTSSTVFRSNVSPSWKTLSSPTTQTKQPLIHQLKLKNFCSVFHLRSVLISVTETAPVSMGRADATAVGLKSSLAS